MTYANGSGSRHFQRSPLLPVTASPRFKPSFGADPQVGWWRRLRPEYRIVTGRTYRRTKRLLDLVLLFLSAPMTLPLMVLIAFLVKLESPGAPAIFVQMRTGKSGRRFRLYKFRTMVPEAEKMKRELLHLNELRWPDFKISDDPRVTRLGRFLRRSSLDELPQLLNILKGEMALVGPRPTSFHADTYKLWHTERLEVTPGLTGLWQVTGRGDMEFDERVRLDIAYVRRRSLTLDALILLRTVAAVLRQEGAY
jgi:lipopolysaccharide/colanic/teichoic acid biosynthesis glycosyltransferase